VFIVQRGTRIEEAPIIILMTLAPLVSLSPSWKSEGVYD
jgi:hypothetical protein